MSKIGSKLLGFIVSMGIIFGMTYLFLPIGYSMMVTWFGGTFPGLIVLLTELYIFLGPYTDLLHLSILIGACLVGGLIAGTAKGGLVVSIITGVLGIVIMIAVGAFSFLGLMGNPLALAELQALVASPPPGVDIVEIITSPVIGDLIDSLLTAILGGFGGGFDIEAILGPVIMPIATWFIVNAVIALACGAIGGKIGNIILPKERKTSIPSNNKEEKDSFIPEYSPDEGIIK